MVPGVPSMRNAERYAGIPDGFAVPALQNLAS
jgi:hypothetical protein